MRWIALLMVTLLVTGCTEAEPQHLPEPSGTYRAEELPDGQVRFWPRSAPVEEGVTYRMSAYTHCGLDHLFDFDTSFWALESGPGHEYLDDPDDEGLVRLVSEDQAIYTSSRNGEFTLIRMVGPRDSYFCE